MNFSLYTAAEIDLNIVKLIFIAEDEVNIALLVQNVIYSVEFANEIKIYNSWISLLIPQ
jgi:hypothetical protein